MTVHLWRVISLVLAVGLLVMACSPAGVEQGQPEQIVVKVGIFPYISFAPFFIAEEEGYFAEQGLDVELVRFQRPAEATVALIHGDLDVSGGPIGSDVLNAIARGADIKYVADKGNMSPTGCTHTALVARRALVEAGELDSAAQLSGRRVCLSTIAESTLGYYMEKVLETAGLTLDDIEIVDLPSPVQLEALEKGTIDLTLAGEPWVTRIVNSGQGVLWMPLQQVVPDFQHAGTLYGPTLLKDHPEVGNEFMVAYLKAVQQYNEGKTERNLEILAKYTGLERELLMQACWAPIRDDGRMNVQSILEFESWAVEKGYLDSTVTEEQFWDSSFVDYANQVLEESSP